MKMVAPLEVGICCRDLESLSRFYVEVLGCRRVNVLRVGMEGARAAALSEGDYAVARLQTPSGERIKLLQPSRPADLAPQAEWILDRRNTVYLTFIIADLGAQLARLRDSGVAVLTGSQPVRLRPDVRLAFARDPEGNLLELVQYDDVAAYRDDLAAARSPD